MVVRSSWLSSRPLPGLALICVMATSFFAYRSFSAKLSAEQIGVQMLASPISGARSRGSESIVSGWRKISIPKQLATSFSTDRRHLPNLGVLRHRNYGSSRPDLCVSSSSSSRENELGKEKAEGGAHGGSVPPEEHGSDGQNKEKVVLRIYNIDKYGLSRLGSKALKKDYNEIYHVAVGAFGSEFWFDHQVNEESLKGIEVRFGYAPAEIVDLGETSKTHEEVQEYLEELREKFNVETYDCFHNNCHNFAQELSMWLTGNSIPQWCLDHGGEALSNLPAKDAETIRWASNKIAKIMMVSWGRYNKERFDRSKRDQAVKSQQQA
mmetsp:Transcript_17764/g.21420  ORF Transcript_17764/g.21420 Transcript_17764/m.21420 type:complete len:323 (+) Transcript_17764:105-1073(+)